MIDEKSDGHKKLQAYVDEMNYTSNIYRDTAEKAMKLCEEAEEEAYDAKIENLDLKQRLAILWVCVAICFISNIVIIFKFVV